MDLFGQNHNKEGASTDAPSNAGLPRIPIPRTDLPLEITFRLERLTPGIGIVVTKDGRFSNDPNDGVVIRKVAELPEHRGLPRWLIGCPNPAIKVLVVPFDEHQKGARELRTGKRLEVIGLSRVSVDSFTFSLPWHGLSLDEKLINKAPDRQILDTIARKVPRLQGALKEFQSGIDSLRAWALNDRTGVMGSSVSHPTADTSMISLIRALKQLDIDVNHESKEMDFTYLGAIDAIRRMNKSVKLEDQMLTIETPLIGDPDPQRPGLSRIYRYVDRETNTLLALQVALALRGELRTALSKAVREHPKSGSITPETDAVLFLHQLGVPLSLEFFHRNSSRVLARALIGKQETSV